MSRGSGGGGDSRYWVGILYPENMRQDWQEAIAGIVELPFAYCVHDMDLKKDGDCAKPHVHIILAWPNTTTYKRAYTVFKMLEAPDLPKGKDAVFSVKPVINMTRLYAYLIHDTDDAKKAGKYQYSPDLRIEGNNFDIHFFGQTSLEEKAEAFKKVVRICKDEEIFNPITLLERLEQEPNHDLYFEACRCNSGFLRLVLDGVYQRRSRAGFFKKNDFEPLGQEGAKQHDKGKE